MNLEVLSEVVKPAETLPTSSAGVLNVPCGDSLVDFPTVGASVLDCSGVTSLVHFKAGGILKALATLGTLKGGLGCVDPQVCLQVV